MAQFLFGVGTLSIQPVGGGSPQIFGSLENISVDFSADLKEINGQYTYAQTVGRGKSKIQCKATSAQLDTRLFNQAFFGQTVSNGSTAYAPMEAHAVPGASAYTVTVTNSTTFAQDQGVVYAATGFPFTQVVTPSSAGQYSVNSSTGVYTFSSADASAAILINYTYTATGGHTLPINNQLMGLAPTFQCVLGDSYNFNGATQSVTMGLYSCVSSKLGLPLKNDDFVHVDLEWQAMANAAGQVGWLSQST